MSWQQLDLWPIHRDQADTLSALLFMAGAGSVEEVDAPGHPSPPPQQPWDTAPPRPPPERVGLRAWFEDATPAEVESELAPHLLGVERAWSPVPDTDWAQQSRDAFPPVHLTPRLRVAPPWFAEPGDLIIDPGSGFGTGQHPTTQAAMALLEPVLDTEPASTLLDVGCGSGLLAIAAARAGWGCQGLDIDADALDNAAENARLNDVNVAWSLTPLQALDTPARVVVANIHAEALIIMAPHLCRLAEGHLILSGIMATKLDAVLDAYRTLPRPELVARDDWRALHYVMPR